MRKLRHCRGGFNRAGMVSQARELRRRETEAESYLWMKLRNRQLRGFKFRRQHQFGNYFADFYCHEAQLVVECDGSVHETNESWQHDRTRDAYMVSQGLRVLRFTNQEVVRDIEAVLIKINRFLVPAIVDATFKNQKGARASGPPLTPPNGRGTKQRE